MRTQRMVITAMVFAVIICATVASTKSAEVHFTSLGGTTPTATHSQGIIASAGNFDDASVDGDTNVTTSADVTFAFEATLNTLSPASNRVLFEFGAGNGFSFLHRSVGDLTVQVTDTSGVSDLGGAVGQPRPLEFDLSPTDIGVQHAFVVSLNVDGTNSTLNLFMDGDKIGTATGSAVTDWAGTNQGGYFAAGGGATILAANFTQQAFVGPTAGEATANSSLRIYEDVFVDQTAIDPAVTIAFQSDAANADAAFGAGGYDNTTNFLASGSGPQMLTDTLSGNSLNVSVDASSSLSIAGNVGLGDTANTPSWDAGDIIDLVFDHDVTLETVWVNHGDTGGSRTIEVQAILNASVDPVDLGILSATGVQQLDPTYALDFGNVLGGDTVLFAGQTLRLVAPSTTDPGRLAGVTVQMAFLIPEPTTIIVAALGLLGMGWLGWRRRKR